MSDRVTFGASDSALREKAEPEDQRRMNDSQGAGKMPREAELATTFYARNSVPSFFPRMSPAPTSVIPRNTMAHTPKAEATYGPFPKAPTSE
jgi:hypothetical protein